jgi:3-hydroxyacyl-CoA dehydrogenase
MAVTMIVGGNPISAAEALKNGLIEEIVDGEPAVGGEAFARKVLAEKRPLRKLRDDDLQLAAAKADKSIFTNAAAAAKKQSRPGSAARCRRSREPLLDQPFDQALKPERELFMKLMNGDQSKAQRYAFFSEREAAKVSGADGTKARDVEQVAIIGAGTMGGGIAMSFANAGIPVTLIETGTSSSRGRRHAEELRGHRRARRHSCGRTAKRMGLITGVVGRERQGCGPHHRGRVRDHGDQEGSVRQARPARQARRCARLQHLVSQHQRDRRDDQASAGRARHALLLARQRHEAVRDRARRKDRAGCADDGGGDRQAHRQGAGGGRCATASSATACSRPRQAGREVPVRRRAAAAGRRRSHQVRHADGPVRDGRSRRSRYRLAVAQDRGIKSEIADAICEAGRFGQKTGKGYYKYEAGSRSPLPDPEIEKLIEETTAKLGIKRRQIDDQEILERLMYPMINEGARILEEKIAARPSDIDVVWLYGYGWPIYRGGPMFYADQVGLKKIADRLSFYAKETNDPSLEPTLCSSVWRTKARPSRRSPVIHDPAG